MINEKSSVACDNVVGRLYNLIYDLKNTTGPSSENVFCKVFLLERNDKNAIFSNYVELFNMCIQGCNEIKRLQPKNIQKHLDTLNKVIVGISKLELNNVPNTNFTENGLNEFRNYMSETLMQSLEFTADFLSEYSEECNIENENIAEIIKEIDEFIVYVLNCELDSELRKILIFHLNSIKESLLKYKLFGPEGIRNSISTSLGALILSRDKIKYEKDMNAMEKAFQIMGKVNALVNFKSNSFKLLSSIFKQITDTE